MGSLLLYKVDIQTKDKTALQPATDDQLDESRVGLYLRYLPGLIPKRKGSDDHCKAR